MSTEVEPVADARIWVRAARLRRDPLLQNSFYLLATTVVMGVLGFAFWILNARLFTVGQIGVATTLVTATSLISYISLLGFNNTFVYYLPECEDPSAQINAGLILVFAAALAVSAAYVVIVPLWIPALGVLQSPIYGIAFSVLTAFCAINLVTDSVFVAYRAARYNLVVDGLIQGGAKLALPLAFVGLGAFGVFAASGVAAVAGAAGSVFFLVRFFGYRPELRIRPHAVRGLVRFSAASYLANLLACVTVLALPLLVLNELGAPAAGYFYVAFQIANLLNAVSYAVSQAMFAEGSHERHDIARLARRTGFVLAAGVLPATVVLVAATPFALQLFGTSYRLHAAGVLTALALGSPAVALNMWASILLRLTGRLGALIWSNVICLVAICGLAAVLVHRGLAWVGWAWLIGNLASGLYCIGVLALDARRPASARAVI